MSEPNVSPPQLAGSRAHPARVLVLSYLWLGTLWLVSERLSESNALILVAAAAVLCIPAVLVQWHRITARRLVRLYPLRRGRLFASIASWRMLGMVLAIVVWSAVAALALVQSHLLDGWEWALMAVAPPLFLGIHAATSSRAATQFRLVAFAWRWSAAFSVLVTFVVLAAAWACGVWLSLDQAATRPLGESVHAAQQAWRDSPSGLVRWGLDAAAWGDAITRTPLVLPEGWAPWQAAAAILLGPALIGFWAQTLAGLSIPGAELRRVIVEPLTDAEVPGPVGPASAAGMSVVVVLTTMLLVFTVAQVDAWLKLVPSAFSANVLRCERIDASVYKVGTIDAVMHALSRVDVETKKELAAACTAVSSVRAASEKVVDRYLDWYYSLGGELARVGQMLAGNADQFMADKLTALMSGDPTIGAAFQDLQRSHNDAFGDSARGYSEITLILEANLLAVHESQCKVERSQALGHLTADLDDFHVRVAGASGAGLAAGAFAAKVTSQAAGKASMKVAGKVLAKAAAKKLAGKGAAAAAGAAAGATIGSILPGAGTLFGGLIGAAFGLVTGVAIDITVLAVDERLNRDDMRKELLEAVHEVTGSYGKAFGCP